MTEIWDRLYYESIPYGRKGIALMALSGVDLALWDTLGKAERKPVAELIGGVQKSSINVYATGPDSDWYAELGVSGQKLPHRWSGSIEDAAALADTARGIIGDDAKLMFDVYMSWDADVTVRMAEALSPYNIYWFEDVLTPDDLEQLGDLRPKIHPINMRGGEHEFGISGFKEMAQHRSYDIWQPDITWCGGISAGLKICELAAAHGVPVVPHRGGEVWALHLIAANDACDDLAEMVLGTKHVETDDLWIGMPAISEGKLSISDEPGFGVRERVDDLDTFELKRNQPDPQIRPVEPRYPSGSANCSMTALMVIRCRSVSPSTAWYEQLDVLVDATVQAYKPNAFLRLPFRFVLETQVGAQNLDPRFSACRVHVVSYRDRKTGLSDIGGVGDHRERG